MGCDCKQSKCAKGCLGKSPEFCIEDNNKKCKKIKVKRCKPCGDECFSHFITEAEERIFLRRNTNSCCPETPCLTACKGRVCATTKKIKKCRVKKDKKLKLTCGKCRPCKKNCC